MNFLDFRALPMYLTSSESSMWDSALLQPWTSGKKFQSSTQPNHPAINTLSAFSHFVYQFSQGQTVMMDFEGLSFKDCWLQSTKTYCFSKVTKTMGHLSSLTASCMQFAKKKASTGLGRRGWRTRPTWVAWATLASGDSKQPTLATTCAPSSASSQLSRQLAIVAGLSSTKAQ